MPRLPKTRPPSAPKLVEVKTNFEVKLQNSVSFELAEMLKARSCSAKRFCSFCTSLRICRPTTCARFKVPLFIFNDSWSSST